MSHLPLLVQGFPDVSVEYTPVCADWNAALEIVTTSDKGWMLSEGGYISNTKNYLLFTIRDSIPLDPARVNPVACHLLHDIVQTLLTVGHMRVQLQLGQSKGIQKGNNVMWTLYPDANQKPDKNAYTPADPVYADKIVPEEKLSVDEMLDYVHKSHGYDAVINSISIHKNFTNSAAFAYIATQTSMFVAPFFTDTALMLLYNKSTPPHYIGFTLDFGGHGASCKSKPSLRFLWKQPIRSLSDEDELMGGRGKKNKHSI
jgi:hypothetical protein